jgi:hypothetical protein
MANVQGRIFQLLASGATIVRAKGVGYIIKEEGRKRRRRRTTKAKKHVAA